MSWKLPQTKSEAERKKSREKQKREAEIEEQMHRAFLKKLNKTNRIGVKRK